MGGTEELRVGGTGGGRDAPASALAELARAGGAAMDEPDYAAALGSARWSAGPLARRPGRRGLALAAAAVLALSFALGLGSGALLAARGGHVAAARVAARAAATEPLAASPALGGSPAALGGAPAAPGAARPSLEAELRAELALFAAELSGAQGAEAYEAAYFPED